MSGVNRNGLSFWGALGFFALLATHLAWIRDAAGFHYDEAWAALFSHRIATESGFWPLAAMSPYTSAWSHYVAALFFEIFGTSLAVYRASGVFLVVTGVLLLCSALIRIGERRAAVFLPWVIAFFPALVFNHRFTIEINTFHVFCLGLLAWGATRRTGILAHLAIASSIVFGVTSHVLFAAPALAAIVATGWNEMRVAPRIRTTAILVTTLLIVFFLRIHILIPEKDKSLGLLIITWLCGAVLLFPAISRSRVVKKLRTPARVLFVLLLIPASFFVLFFAEGSWAAAFFTGGSFDFRGAALIWTALGLVVWEGRRHFRLAEAWGQTAPFLPWILLTWIAVAAMATKPAPRYFEIPLLLLAVLFSLGLARTRPRIAMAALSLWIVAGSLQISFNYLKPILAAPVPERDFRFVFFKDSSSDTLSKQRLASELAALGCRWEQLRSDDVRIMEPLEFLSIGDWALNPEARCPFEGVIRLERRSRSATPGKELGPFVLGAGV